MSILVTGGTGVIGSMVVRKLVEKGIEPVVVARHEDLSLLKDVKRKITFVQGDVLDFEKVNKIIRTQGIKRIIHASALMPGETQTDPIKGFNVNSFGTLNLLEAGRRFGIDRFVYTSAKGVYSPIRGEYDHPTYKPIDENYPREMQMGMYGATKLCGEIIGFQYQRDFNVEFVALRFGMTYGPGKLLRHGPLAVHSKIIENSMLNKPVRIPQGSEQKDDMIYTKDCANAVVLATFAKGLTSNVFNIGSGVGKTLGDFSNAVKKILPAADIEIGPGLNYLDIGHTVYSIFDITRARKELKFNPEFDLEKSVQDYVETMRLLNIEPVYTP